MHSTTNLFSIKQLPYPRPILPTTSLNFSKTFTISKKQLQNDSSISSQSHFKNSSSLKQTSSKFKKHKQSIESIESLSKSIKDQERRIRELRELIREEKEEIVQKKAGGWKLVRELEEQARGLERQNDNWKQNSKRKVAKRQREVEQEVQRIRGGRTMVKQYRKQVSKMSITKEDDKESARKSTIKKTQTLSEITNEERHYQTTTLLSKITLDKQHLFVTLEQQQRKQLQQLTQQISKVISYTKKIEDTQFEERVMRELLRRYSKNKDVIDDIKRGLLGNKGNESKLLRGIGKAIQVRWEEFPILESLKNGSLLYSTVGMEESGFRGNFSKISQ